MVNCFRVGDIVTLNVNFTPYADVYHPDPYTEIKVTYFERGDIGIVTRVLPAAGWVIHPAYFVTFVCDGKTHKLQFNPWQLVYASELLVDDDDDTDYDEWDQEARCHHDWIRPADGRDMGAVCRKCGAIET